MLQHTEDKIGNDVCTLDMVTASPIKKRTGEKTAREIMTKIGLDSIFRRT
jgi:hypothetical protein